MKNTWDCRKRFTMVYICFAALNFFTLSGASAAQMQLIESLTGNKLMGKLSQPSALFFDEVQKRLYIADTNNNRLVSFDSEFNFIAEFDAGKRLNKPIDVIRNSHGEFFVISDTDNGLYFIDVPKMVFKRLELAGAPKRKNPISFYRLAIDKNDNLYLTDRANGRILALTPEGRFVREIMLNNRPVDFSDIRLDMHGNIYSLSTVEGKVYMFNNDGKFISSFGARGSGDQEFQFPTSIAVDHKGYLYVLDRHKSNVMVFRNDGRFQFSFFRKGRFPGELYNPSDIHVDKEGKLYIVDQGNNRVQIFHVEE